MLDGDHHSREAERRSKHWDVSRCLREFAAHMHRCNSDIEAAMMAAARLGCWRAAVAQFAEEQVSDPDVGANLLDFWSTYGLCSIPSGLKDELAVFVDALRRHLPPYSGPRLTLYRGELLERHARGIHGIAWTTKFEVAEMFAARRRLDEGAGIVLQAHAPSSAIATGPTPHSVRLQEYEYIVDPRLIKPQAYVIAPTWQSM